METSDTSTPAIVDVERTTLGVVVTFADGVSALFTADLLHAKLNEAVRLPDEDEDVS